MGLKCVASVIEASLVFVEAGERGGGEIGGDEVDLLSVFLEFTKGFFSEGTSGEEVEDLGVSFEDGG